MDRDQAVPVIGLTSKLRLQDGMSAIGADLHFRVTSDCSAMLAVIGVQTRAGRGLAFAPNDRFTDEVLGFAGSA